MKQKTLNEFVQEAKQLHSSKYSYDNTIYNGAHTKVNIKCNSCDNIFEQTPNSHLKRRGCPYCSGNKKLTTQDFITMAQQIHGNVYGYTQTEYISSKTNVNILCHTHGSFLQSPNSHLNKQGCPKCGDIRRRRNKTLSKNMFIDKAIKVHGALYDYTETIYTGMRNPVIIKCPIHGNFSQKPHTHLQGCGCQKCNTSKGELRVSQVLSTLSIEYIREYTFINCKNVFPLPFDFYIPSLHMCIEYDGELHYMASTYHGGDEKLRRTQENDFIKTKYCIDNDIILLRIPYTEYKNIHNIITSHIKIVTSF